MNPVEQAVVNVITEEQRRLAATPTLRDLTKTLWLLVAGGRCAGLGT